MVSFLVFTSNYALYAQYKRLYVLNYTDIMPTHTVMHVIRKICDIIMQKTKVCHSQTFI